MKASKKLRGEPTPKLNMFSREKSIAQQVVTTKHVDNNEPQLRKDYEEMWVYLTF